MAKIANTELVKITRQTFIDFGSWLSRTKDYSQEQLQRLQNEDDYLALIKLASDYWLIGALTAQLRAKEVLAKLPQQLHDYLIYLESTYQQRSETIKKEVIFATNILQAQDIDVVVIKGATNLFNGVAEPISKRYMNDIDLLIPEDKFQQAQQVLKDASYTTDQIPFYDEPVYGHHAKPIIRKESSAYIELHRWPLKKIYTEVLTPEEVWRESVPLSLADKQSALQCSPTQQVILSIAHSELSNRGFADKHLDFRQMYSLYEICCHFDQQINWLEVIKHFERMNAGQIVQSVCHSLHQLFTLELPIIDKLDKQAEKNFEKSIAQFIDNQNKTKFALLLERISIIARGYQRENIYTIYGSRCGYKLWLGRFKHFIRHVKLAFYKSYRLLNTSFSNN